MKHLRCGIIAISLVVALACVVLLMNFTAPNPTGRRYSSSVMQGTDSNDKGGEGERSLEKDLGVINNNRPPSQCICSLTSLSEPGCTCFAQIALTGTPRYRKPDFVTGRILVDVKNKGALDADDYRQLKDYAEAATQTHRQLWIYTRVDATVAPRFVELAQSTGGDVVNYLATPDWNDPIDQAARAGLAISATLVVLVTVGGRAPRPQTPRRTRSTPPGPLGSAIDRVQDIERFTQRSKEEYKRRLD